MKDWLGKAWDFLIQGVGSLIVRQKWTDYKQWTDFGGFWLFKAEYRWVVSNERIQNPSYKFFWWWLRYGVFVILVLVNMFFSNILGHDKIEPMQ
jgi:hypothetical protein